MASFAELIAGSAVDVAKNVGQGAPEAYARGAELALKKEQLEQQREQLEAQKRQLEQQKIEKLYNFIGNAKEYKNAAERGRYLKSAVGYRNAMGISPAAISDEGILSLGTDENLGRAFTLDNMVRSGEMTRAEALDLATNPLKRDQFAKIVPTPPEFMSSTPDLSDAQREAVDRAQKLKEAGMRASVSGAKDDRLSDQYFKTYAAGLNDDVAQRLKPVIDQKASLDFAAGAQRQLMEQFNKTGKVNANLANAMARSLVKAFNSGAMTDRDVADLQIRPGVEAWTEANWAKWIEGSADIKLIKNLGDIINVSRQASKQKAMPIYQGLESRLLAYKDEPEKMQRLAEMSGLGAYRKVLLDEGRLERLRLYVNNPESKKNKDWAERKAELEKLEAERNKNGGN